MVMCLTFNPTATILFLIVKLWAYCMEKITFSNFLFVKGMQ